MKRALLILILFWLGIISAVYGKENTTVFVGLPPIGYIVQSIGGEAITVEIMVSPGQSPHTYEPTPRQLLDLSRADLYMSIELPFEERLLAKISGAGYKLIAVDISSGIKRRNIEPDDGDDSHGHDQEADPHIWLSPKNLALLAENTKKALAAGDPEKTDYFQNNLERFLKRLNVTDLDIGKILAPLKEKSLFVFHPAFGYFTDYYGLTQVAVETGGKNPSPRQIQALIEKAREQNVHVIFVQPQFDPSTAEAVAKAIEGAVVPIDPLEENVLESLEDMAGKIEAALK